MGTLVAQGTAAFVLADLSFVKAAFGVPDLALQGLKLGDVLHLTTDGVPGREFSGRISRISPSADQNSRVFEVEVSIANPDGSLKPGMIASLSVNEGTATPVETPVVPLTAIMRAKDSNNEYAVFVVEERDGKHFARPRNVTLGDSIWQRGSHQERSQTWRDCDYHRSRTSRRWRTGTGHSIETVLGLRPWVFAMPPKTEIGSANPKPEDRRPKTNTKSKI